MNTLSISRRGVALVIIATLLVAVGLVAFASAASAAGPCAWDDPYDCDSYANKWKYFPEYEKGNSDMFVVMIQEFLWRWDYFDSLYVGGNLCARHHTGAVDGIYGNCTEAAVRRYQLFNDLNKDGVVGRQTWKSMQLEGTINKCRKGTYTGVCNYWDKDWTLFNKKAQADHHEAWGWWLIKLHGQDQCWVDVQWGVPFDNNDRCD